MRRAVARADLAAALGAAGRDRVAQRFALSRCVDSHLLLWSEMLGSQRR